MARRAKRAPSASRNLLGSFEVCWKPTIISCNLLEVVGMCWEFTCSVAVCCTRFRSWLNFKCASRSLSGQVCRSFRLDVCHFCNDFIPFALSPPVIVEDSRWRSCRRRRYLISFARIMIRHLPLGVHNNNSSGLDGAIGTSYIKNGIAFEWILYLCDADAPKWQAKDGKQTALHPYKRQLICQVEVGRHVEMTKIKGTSIYNQIKVRGYEIGFNHNYEGHHEESFKDCNAWNESVDPKVGPNLNRAACSIGMRLMYVFRTERFSLLRICWKLAIRFVMWTENNDKRLDRLMTCVHGMLGHRHVAFEDDDQRVDHVECIPAIHAVSSFCHFCAPLVLCDIGDCDGKADMSCLRSAFFR